MNGQMWIDLAALAVATASFVTAYVRTIRLQGADRQRIKSTEDAIARLATAASVEALSVRVGDLEGDLKLVATALTKVAVIESKLDGLDRLMMRETDEIKYTLRALEKRIFSSDVVVGRVGGI